MEKRTKIQLIMEITGCYNKNALKAWEALYSDYTKELRESFLTGYEEGFRKCNVCVSYYDDMMGNSE